MIDPKPEVSAMYLEASAMVLLELYRALEADRSRETRSAARRAVHVAALAPADSSDRVAVVALGDSPGSRGDASPDLGRIEDLEPGSGAEHRQRRLVGPVHAHPKS